MKLRETKSGNLKLTMTYYEADVVRSILSHVRLGVGGASAAVFDMIDAMDHHSVSNSTDVSFEYNDEEGFVINV